MEFEDELYQYFNTANFYEILNVPQDASEEDIKKAYKKLALKVHPDRVDSAQASEANKKFQALSMVSETLLDPRKREIYDETGLTKTLFDNIDEDADWYQYWRNLFPSITLKDIQNFEKQYRDSAAEKLDIKDSYLKNDGDILKIIDDVMCATFDDFERIRKVCCDMIVMQEVELLPLFNNPDGLRLKKARKKAMREEKQSKAMLKDREKEFEDAFEKSRINQMVRFEDLIDRLTEKYCTKKPKKSKKSKKKVSKSK